MKAFKVLSVLLSYPTEELVAAAPELGAALDAERALPKAERDALQTLLDEIAGGDIYDLQERYGLLFDRSKALALHLFEHVHGESRDRGQAMVDLKEMYEKAGFEISANELPDYLPLFLEFLSTQSPDAARELLGQTTHILAALAERLDKRSSSYKTVFDALLAMAQEAPRRDIVDELLKTTPDVDPMDLEALDAVWQETEVRFGSSSSCEANVSPPKESTIRLH
ncbi:MAG: nitrate reductase molybdenum cofactor assembly chaperone [Burkholderiales bacterium]|jgi:nitrate reductase delta subunit|nr:nitrate reductase molybdenum cofactor assembly chaperone [Burkholderiales bacterium]